MSFLSGALSNAMGGAASGGQNNFHANAATGNTQFTAQNLQPAINTAQGDYSSQLAHANEIYQNQGNLANQLLAQSQGQGPNIAQMQLQQATDRNNQQAAGQMASQRGMNPALAARLIAQNQAANNQQAAGQSGLMRAQQQLAAQGALANVYGQQAGQSIQAGGVANQNLGINQTALSNQNQQVVTAKNNADVLNQKTAQSNAEASSKSGGGLLNALGGLGSMALGAATGGLSTLATSALGALSSGSNGGGNVPTSQEDYNFMTHAHGGEIHDFRSGGHVPGKAKVQGDSAQNDTVPAIVSPGEVVLPRSVTQSEDPAGRAAKFMEALHKSKQKSDEPKGFSKVLEAKRKMQELMDHIDKMHKVIKKDK